MLAERSAVLVPAAIGLVLLALVRPDHRPPAAPPPPAPPPAPTDPDAMRGPYDSLAGDCSTCAIDASAAQGTAPIEEYTVITHTETGGLGEQRTYSLAIHTAEGWWFRDLASAGAFCGGMGTPTWVDVDADAPRQHGASVTVHYTEHLRRGDARWAAETTVTCEVTPGRAPHCQ